MVVQGSSSYVNHSPSSPRHFLQFPLRLALTRRRKSHRLPFPLHQMVGLPHPLVPPPSAEGSSNSSFQQGGYRLEERADGTVFYNFASSPNSSTRTELDPSLSRAAPHTQHSASQGAGSSSSRSNGISSSSSSSSSGAGGAFSHSLPSQYIAPSPPHNQNSSLPSPSHTASEIHSSSSFSSSTQSSHPSPSNSINVDSHPQAFSSPSSSEESTASQSQPHLQHSPLFPGDSQLVDAALNRAEESLSEVHMFTQMYADIRNKLQMAQAQAHTHTYIHTRSQTHPCTAWKE